MRRSSAVRLLLLPALAVTSIWLAVPAAQAQSSTPPLCNGHPATHYPGAPGGNDTSSGTVTGTNGNDVIYGTNGPDTIDGRSGHDTICSRDGEDTVRGDGGNDTIHAGDGDDNAGGGAGNDSVSGGPGNDTVRGGSGNDEVAGGQGTDVVQGGEGNDKVSGGEGDDFLIGGAGSDVCSGGNGNDRSDRCENNFNVEQVSGASVTVLALEAAPAWTDMETNDPNQEIDVANVLAGDPGDSSRLTYWQLVEQGDITRWYTTP
jgi:hypothetical protein